MSDFSKDVIERQAKIMVLTDIIKGETDAGKKKSFVDKVTALKRELVDLAVGEATKTTENTVTTYPSIGDFKNAQLTAAQVAALPRFKGLTPDCVSKFLTCLRQLKKACSLSDAETISHARGKFGAEAYRTLEQYEDENGEFTTFESFTSFIKKHWGSQFSTYQLLETTFAMNRPSNETWTQFNNSINTAMSKVKIAHSELLKSKNKVVNVDNVYELFQNSIILANINTFSNELYRQITAEANNLSNPNVLAARATTLETQGNFQANSIMFGSNKPLQKTDTKVRFQNPQFRNDPKVKSPNSDKVEKNRSGPKNGRGNGRGYVKRKPNNRGFKESKPRSTYCAAQDWSCESDDDEASKNSQ